jgi:hypothetical protein
MLEIVEEGGWHDIRRRRKEHRRSADAVDRPRRLDEDLERKCIFFEPTAH